MNVLKIKNFGFIQGVIKRGHFESELRNINSINVCTYVYIHANPHPNEIPPLVFFINQCNGHSKLVKSLYCNIKL